MPKDIRHQLVGVACLAAVVLASALLLQLRSMPLWLKVTVPLFLCWSLFMTAEIEPEPEDFCA